MSGSQMLLTSNDSKANLLIKNSRVLDPREGIDSQCDVLIEAGRIKQISPAGSINDAEGLESIDAEGMYLFPGFVDPHVHLRTPGQEYKESIATGTQSGAAGGFVALVAMPNTDPVVDSASLLGSLREKARQEAVIPIGFSAAITRGLQGKELTEMAELADVGAVCFTDDGRPVADAGLFRRAVQYQKLAGKVLALHEEDVALSAGGSMREGEVSAKLGVAGVPSISESTIVARDAAIAGYEGGRIHFQHLSAVASIQALEAAKQAGVQVSGEASPHHLCLTDESLLTLNTSMKMNPPLGYESDRQALIEALRSGVVECIATDHAPHAREEKERPFEQAPMGTTGLETSFASVYTNIVLPGLISLDVVVERMSAGARLMDLQTPLIKQGEAANLVLVDLEKEWTAGDGGYYSRSENCCFDGNKLKGQVQMTVAAGAVVYRHGQPGKNSTQVNDQKVSAL